MDQSSYRYCRAPISEESARMLQAMFNMDDKAAHNARAVLVDGVRYSSMRSAADAIGATICGVSRAVRDGRDFKGHKVEYADL